MDVFDKVKDYYGKVIKCKADFTTECPLDDVRRVLPKDIRDAFAMIHFDISSRSYRCAIVIPEELDGVHILDLGSGLGSDCFVLSKLVGASGRVTGVDMTEELLEVANKYIDYHMEKFNYTTPNIDFIHGYIERLHEAGVKENAYDIVFSNCVVSLSPDKPAVLKEAYRVLKVGGELYFSDMYTDRILPESVREDEVLWGEGLGGALRSQDLEEIAAEIGFSVPRLVGAKELFVDKEEHKKITGDARYVSVTYRLFKLPPGRKLPCQVVYLGGIRWHEAELNFDYKHSFKAGDTVCVNSELSTILQSSRFQKHFTFQSNDHVDMIIDPFEYMAAVKKCCAQTGEAKTGCCAQKS